MLHDERYTPGEIAAAHRELGERIEAPWRDGWNRHANSRDPQRPLRVGFVSADLRNHPVARFLEPAWRELDRTAFELHAYDMQPADDPIARSLRALATRWTDVPATNDAQLDARIRADGIDILFDLSGHTARNRLGVFARKPAPIQVSWIGYPGSTGLRAMDYRLVDAIAAPYGRLDDQFSERLAYLPYMSVFERPANLPEVAAAPQAAGAPLTFGSFNRVNKLGERTLALWARVLREVPDARLLVGALPDEPRAQELRRRFAVHGIGSERLLLRQRVDLADYLALHAQVDILLDTLPFSSGTTANFALWMGVPTLTLAGDVLAQRLGAARMAAAGLPGFIAESADEYVARAREWARRPQDLARLRGELRARMQDNAARQPAELAHALGARLREMWQRWCAGLEPERLA
jgi:predicted O-linked N-acetylglucosamine transferase (SPINDLY family)